MNDILMPRKTCGRQGLLVGGREMNRACDIGGRPTRTGSGDARLSSTAGAYRLGALALLVSLAVLSAPAAFAEDPEDVATLSGTAYIINLDHFQPEDTAQGSTLGAWSGFGAVTSPSGVILPDASAYLNLGGAGGEFTYLTPRIQGVQLSWTTDRAAAGLDGGVGIGSQTYVSRPTSIGANFAQGGEDVEFSLGGDYGKSSKAVPGVVNLVDDQELLRVGAHARIREFTLGTALGGDVDPGNFGQTLSWDAFGRYDFGALAIGFVYNYTVESDGSSGGGGGMPGTLQGGVSYSFTPRMAVTTNLAYGNYVDQSGSDDSAIAGVLGFSLDF